jgi:hypothetical protein
MVRTRYGSRNQQRTEHRAGLIHGRMQAESGSVSNNFSRFRKQDVPRRTAQALSSTFRDH